LLRSPVEALPRIGRPLRRNQVSNRLIDAYTELAWTPVDEIGGFLYHDLDGWVHLANAMREFVYPLLSSSSLPEGWKQEELNELEKGMVCWRDRGYGSLVYQEPPFTSNRDQARLLRFAIGSIRAKLIAALKAGAIAARPLVVIPTNKGKGAPLWAPGTDRTAAFALALPYAEGLRLGEIDEWLETYAHRGLGGCLTSYMRVQGGRKPTPYVAPIGTQLYIIGEQIRAKVRRVDGFSYSKQLGAAAYHTILRQLMNEAFPYSMGTVTNVQANMSGFKNAYATDVSTFDDSISWQLQQAVTTDLHEPLAVAMAEMGLISEYERDYTIEYEHWVPYAPILAPSSYLYEPVRLVDRRGGVPSGSRGTSNNDTLYNLARIMACHKELGFNAEIHVFGDDTLLLSDQELPSNYVEWNKDAGFDLKLAGAPIFLQRMMPLGCTLFARMVVACLNREARFEASSVLHLAVGIRVRKELLRSHPLYDMFLPALQHMALADHTGRMTTALTIERSPMTTNELMIRLSESNVPLQRLEDVSVWAEEIGVSVPVLDERKANSQEELTTLSLTASRMAAHEIRTVLGRYGNK